MRPQSRPMRTLIQRARRGSRFCISARPARRRWWTWSRRLVGAGGAVRSGPTDDAGDGDDAVRCRRLHAEERARHDLDALRRLVARRFELEHALHLAQLGLLSARFAELVAELHVPAAQAPGAARTAVTVADDGEGPQDQERALRSHDATFSRGAQLGAARARISLGFAARWDDGLGA